MKNSDFKRIIYLVKKATIVLTIIGTIFLSLLMYFSISQKPKGTVDILLVILSANILYCIVQIIMYYIIIYMIRRILK